MQHSASLQLSDDPLQGALQNLAAVISTRTNITRMNKIPDHPIQNGTSNLEHQGFDITFQHVGFSYNPQEAMYLCPYDKITD